MSESSQHTNDANEEVSLKDLFLKIGEWWRYILSNWLIILIFGLLGGAFGFYYAYTNKAIYTATTTFVLEGEKGANAGLGNLSGLASMAGIDLGGSGGSIFQGDNIMELYRSRKMIEKTLLTKIQGSNTLLIEQYISFNKLKDNWDKNPSLKNLNFSPDSSKDGEIVLKRDRIRDSLLGVIVSDIKTNFLTIGRLDEKLSIIKVDVKAKDEFFAKAFNEQIVKNVNEFYLQTKVKKSLQNVLILQHKTDSVRSVMNGAIYNAIAVADATPNLNPIRQVQRVAPVQKAQFSAETNKAILGYLVQNLEMSKMALMKETPLLEVIDKPIYPLKVENFGKIKGVILGGILGGFIICFVLVLRRLIKNILV